MAATLTAEQKNKIRYHLGYPVAESVTSYNFGVPALIQTNFLLEKAMELIPESALPIVVDLIAKLDAVDEARFKMRLSVVAAGAGSLRLHPLAEKGKLGTDSLEDEHSSWAFKLAEFIRAPVCPSAQRFRRGGPGSRIAVR